MMNVTYRCPACHGSTRAEFLADSVELKCSHCGRKIAISADAVQGNRVERCLVCPSAELYARKDFPQKLGVTLVVIGFAASCVTWAHYLVLWTFAILFLTA